MDHRASIGPAEQAASGLQSGPVYEDNNSIGSQTEDSCSSATSEAPSEQCEADGATRQPESTRLEPESHQGQYSSLQPPLPHPFNPPAPQGRLAASVNNIIGLSPQLALERLACDGKQAHQLASMSQSHIQMKARQACNRASNSSADQTLAQQPAQGNSGECEDVKHVDLFGVQIVALIINGKERLCLAQISNTLLKEFSYNEIHNRRVALGITCVQCTPIQLEMLRRAGAMPSSSRRCGMITMREAERLCRSFLAEEQPPELPEHFYFTVAHRVNYGCKGRFIPSRYISSRAKCIECFHCGEFYSPNKFIFHSHKQPDATDCNPPDSPNINSWRKHINLDSSLEHSQEIKYAWEDVKSLFNGGTRRRASVSIVATGSGAGASSDAAPAVRGADERGQFADEGHTGDSERDKTGPCAANKRRKVAHNIEDLSTPAEFDDRSAQKAAQRGSMLAGAHLSQSERRKLPMGWPANSQAGGNSASHRSQQLAGSQQTGARLGSRAPRPAGANIPPRRMSPCDPAERDPNKRLLTTTNWHQPRLNPAASAERHRQSAPFEPAQERIANHFDHCSSAGNMYEKRADHSILGQQKRASQMGDELMQANSELAMNKLLPQAPMGCASQTSLLPSGQSVGPQSASPSSFIYSQLYSQLLQSQLGQQQTRQPQSAAALLPMEAQLALRHHIWSSLLANLRCNPAALEALGRDNVSANGSQSTAHTNYTLGNPLGQQSRSSSLLAGFNQPPGDPANLSMSPHLAPAGFNPISTMMQMYGGPATGQVSLGDPSAASMFTINENGNDGCK